MLTIGPLDPSALVKTLIVLSADRSPNLAADPAFDVVANRLTPLNLTLVIS